ncbi:PHP domain-containing protein [Thermodesulfobacteriota bacterium]
MLTFARNKLVSVWKKDEDTLSAHGVLEDDIYALEVDVSLSLSELEILSVDGKWNRAENSECVRAIPFLQEAVGFKMGEGFIQKVQKLVGRKSCRHLAEMLLECCYSAREAARLIRWEAEKKKRPDMALDEVPSEQRVLSSAPAKDSQLTSKKPQKKDKGSRTFPKETMGSGETIIDLHVHTSPASPCSSVSAGELIEEAKKIGLDGICLTDHNYMWDATEIEKLREKHDFLILRGNEITTDQGDVLVFGFDKDVQGIIELKELRKEVLKTGGFMILAHPFRGFLTFGIGQLGLTVEKAMKRPLFESLDAVEVLNSKVTEKENRFAEEVAKGLNLHVTGGSDAHALSEVGIYATRFSERIDSETDLIKALKRGNCVPIAFREEIKTRS